MTWTVACWQLGSPSWQHNCSVCCPRQHYSHSPPLLANRYGFSVPQNEVWSLGCTCRPKFQIHDEISHADRSYSIFLIDLHVSVFWIYYDFRFSGATFAKLFISDIFVSFSPFFCYQPLCLTQGCPNFFQIWSYENAQGPTVPPEILIFTIKVKGLPCLAISMAAL